MAGTISILSGYGVFELKRAYRINMTIGILIASLFLLTSVGGWALLGDFDSEPVVIEDGGFMACPDTLDIIIIQPREPPDPPKEGGAVLPEDISFGQPIATDDTLVTEDVKIATNREIELLISSKRLKSFEKFGNRPIVMRKPDGLYPDQKDFIAYEEAPILIENVKPIYPEVARRAGIEGEVWVNVLLDKSGNVRDVQILKNSGANAGFEEAAIEVARQTVWKPAISNGQPVALWVSYKIVFTLRNCGK